MPDPVDPKAFLALVELAIANMYEVEAIGELLEQKGLLTKDEIITLAKDLNQKSITPDPINTSPRDTPLGDFNSISGASTAFDELANIAGIETALEQDGAAVIQDGAFGFFGGDLFSSK